MNQTTKNGTPGSGKPSAGNPGQGYLLHDASEKSLEDLDSVYSQWDASKKAPVIFNEVPTKSWAAWWGAGDGTELRLIGVRAKLWALALLLVERRQVPKNSKKIAEAIIEYDIRSNEGNLERQLTQIHSGRDNAVSIIQGLISQSRKTLCPPGNARSIVSDLATSYAIYLFFGSRDHAAAGSFRTCFDAEARSIASFYQSLDALIPKNVEPRNPRTSLSLDRIKAGELSEIDPSLRRDLIDESGARRYIRPSPADHRNQIANEIDSKLKSRKRIITVSGEPFVGKKTKVKSWLRCRAESDDSLVYSVRAHSNSNNEIHLPIQFWSAKGVHYRALVEKVVSFLNKYHEAISPILEDSDSQVAEFSPIQNTSDLDAVVEWIFDKCKHLPAVFIFGDTDVLRRDHGRHAVRDIGIAKLLVALVSANPDTRIILTTPTMPNDIGERLKLFSAVVLPETIDVPARTFGEFTEMIPQTVRNQFPFSLLNLETAVIRGDDLIAVAASAGLVEIGSTKAELHRNDMFTAIEELLDNKNDPFIGRRKLYDVLIKQIDNEGLLPAICLIAASEDGVRTDSMFALLETWQKQAPQISIPDSCRALDEKLEKLRARAGNRFLLHGPMPRYDPEEYGLDEHHTPNDYVWEIEPVVSAGLLAAMARNNREDASISYRLIARIARRRAQHKKVNMRGPIGPRAAEEASRDIQCYRSLLASIVSIGEQCEDGGPLRLSETEIFSIDPMRFKPGRALRFAVLSLLREDIDHDHRLTMVFDEDALRLEMYLLLFRPLGDQPPLDSDAPMLSDTLPSHLRGPLFSTDETLEILTTLALSAFHAQQFSILEKAVHIAECFVSELGLSAAKLARIRCCKLDAMIHLGGPITGEGTHADTLALAKGYIRELEPSQTKPQIKTDEPATVPADIKALMRMLAREADLTWLAGEGEYKAYEIYRRLEDFETSLGSSAGQHDPVILSGRVARRYIRLLLDGLLGLVGTDASGLTQDIILEKAEALISVNQSRLRRFSGADRVGVMLDMSRMHAAKGQFPVAAAYAQSAKRRAFSGNVSHGGKVDVLAVIADVSLRHLETAIDRNIEAADCARYLEVIKVATRDLLFIATSHGYRPAEALACIYEGRLLLVRKHFERSDKGLDRDTGSNNVNANIARAATLLSKRPDRVVEVALARLKERAGIEA